jgi:hypothetical protein
VDSSLPVVLAILLQLELLAASCFAAGAVVAVSAHRTFEAHVFPHGETFQ